MKKKIPIFIFLLVMILGIVLGIYYYISNRPKFNDSYVNGNTAGNLYNAGLICENNGSIFFANPSDGNTLYSMDLDGGHLTKLTDDVASFINADDHYVYYVRNNPSVNDAFSFLNVNTNSLCRVSRDGHGKEIILDNEPCMYASLFGNYIYYVHYEKKTASTLYKVKIDGTEKQQVDEEPFFTCSTDGQYFYYNGLHGNHNVWRYDTTSYGSDLIFSGNCWMPTVTSDGTIYLMDCDDNYKLSVGNATTGEKTTLCDDRIDFYNVCGDYIYFQRSDKSSPALCRIRTDGSDYQVISEGVYTDINVSSTDVYFRDYNSGIMYRSPITNPAATTIFNPGK